MTQMSFNKIDKAKIAKSIKSVYEETEKEINAFLKTQKGLNYLSVKYPTLSVSEAIREYKINAYRALNY